MNREHIIEILENHSNTIITRQNTQSTGVHQIRFDEVADKILALQPTEEEIDNY